MNYSPIIEHDFIDASGVRETLVSVRGVEAGRSVGTAYAWYSDGIMRKSVTAANFHAEGFTERMSRAFRERLDSSIPIRF